MLSILNCNARKTPALLSLAGMMLSIGLTTGAAQASDSLQKGLFLAGVDESISGKMIHDNMFQYVDSSVDLHCRVSYIASRYVFNANCSNANIVILHDVIGLSPGQAIRVIGTVEQPIEGNNGNGGDMYFPTVKAAFIE